MVRATVSTLFLVFTSTAVAQTDGGVAAVSTTSGDADTLRRDFDQKLEAARREVDDLRKEMRAQLATQSVAQGWQEDWVDEKRKLELVTFDGYLRMRPDLFWRFDLGSGNDPAGYSLWPRNPNSADDRTNVGVNMRFRFEPSINVSEEVRIRTQIDALDNVVWGSTPDYSFSRNGGANYWNDRNDFSIFSQSQTAPRSGVNSLNDSIMMKRVWGEVSTPVGILRFGRMGSHWGLGMLHNDGNGIDNDWGDTVDRISFTAEPFAGFYVTPMLDVNIVGTTSLRLPEGGQPFNLSNYDDGINYILAVARRDTDTEARAKLDSGQTVFNYGVHFSYRNQRTDSVDTLSQPFTTDGRNVSGADVPAQYVRREANLFMPDLWAKLERKNFRIEGEFAAILGSIGNRALSGANANQPGANQRLDVWQFAAVVQGEYKLLNGDLEIGGEVGFASGDQAPGFGNAPRRQSSGLKGDIDGPQYRCSGLGGCSDNTIRNFRFNRDYRVDMILYREILGGVTDSLYVKPKVQYRITQGLNVFVAGIYSRAIFAESTPSAGNVSQAVDPNLGLEFNAGARYETEDGFYAQAQYGILFPLGGFNRESGTTAANLVNAQAARGVFGIKF
ncbi:MAG: TIGR04551 family protein [Myxococcales bacterium]|nr:TIGR04551 family protein [Myxococcales bacterium]